MAEEAKVGGHSAVIIFGSKKGLDIEIKVSGSGGTGCGIL